MTCPDCTFWNQDILTCVTMDYSCHKSVSVFTDEGVTAQGAYSENCHIMFQQRCW